MGSILIEAGKRSSRFEMWMILICEVVEEIVEVQYGLISFENKPIILFSFLLFFSLFSLLFY